MRSNLTPKEFFLKMRKKPELQRILDNFDDMSIDDIEELQQPKWIRDVLVQIKTDHTILNDPARVADIIRMADEMEAATPKQEIKYEVRTYYGESFFPPVTGGMSVQLNDLDLFYVVAPGELKISSTVMKLTPDAWKLIMNNSKVEGMMTAIEFTKFLQEQLANKYSESETTVIGEKPSALSAYNVKIY